jgi:hypothetical protein
MSAKERVPIWIYRPRVPEERKAKYAYCIAQGCSQDQARIMRDWDWPRIYYEVRHLKKAMKEGGVYLGPQKRFNALSVDSQGDIIEN